MGSELLKFELVPANIAGGLMVLGKHKIFRLKKSSLEEGCDRRGSHLGIQYQPRIYERGIISSVFADSVVCQCTSQCPDPPGLNLDLLEMEWLVGLAE